MGSGGGGGEVVKTPFGPSFPFFPTFFFSRFLSFLLRFIFSFFSFLFTSSFFDFLMFFIFFFHFSAEVGAPWRCGILTTQGGTAGIGLGRLLGGEHASTLQSGVGASPDCIIIVVVCVRH